MKVCRDSSLLSRQIIADSLSEEEISGLKTMFQAIDSDNSGAITFEELKIGLKKLGSNLAEEEVRKLMEAVSAANISRCTSLDCFATRRLARCACTPVQSMKQNASGMLRPLSYTLSRKRCSWCEAIGLREGGGLGGLQ
jgi:hypothetical protein